MELLGAYCLGDEECTEYAWAIFADALHHTDDPHRTLFWIGQAYADLGFFADAAETLGELCSRFEDAEARRLLAEVLWWRDNAYRIPWIPPAGDGSRYDRMMQFVDPHALTTQEVIAHFRHENQQARHAAYHPTLTPALAEILTQVLPDENLAPAPSLVDWGFLDEDDGQPGEPADWVKKQIARFKRRGDDPLVQEMVRDMEVDRFYELGAPLEGFSVSIREPALEMPLLKRLGEAVFVPAPGILSLLQPAYQAITQTALRAAFQEQTGEENGP